MYNLFFLHCNMLFYFWSKYDPDQFLILFLLMYTLQYAVFNCSHWLFFTRHTLIHCSIKRPLIQAMMIWFELNFCVWFLSSLSSPVTKLASYPSPAGLSAHISHGQRASRQGPGRPVWAVTSPPVRSRISMTGRARAAGVERCCFGGLLCGLWSSNPHIHRHRCPLYGPGGGPFCSRSSLMNP